MDSTAPVPERTAAPVPERTAAPRPAVPAGRNSATWGLTQLIVLAIAVVDLILAFDFGLRAIRAGNTGFSWVVYQVAGWLERPFDGILRTTVSHSYVLHWGDALAAGVYTLAAALLIRLVQIPSRSRAVVS